MAKALLIFPSRRGRSHFSFCSGGAEAHEHLRVPGIGSVAIEDFRRDEAVPHDLREGRVVSIVEAGAPLALRQEQVPETLAFGLGLELFHHRRDPPPPEVVGVNELFEVRALRRDDVVVEEAPDALHVVLSLFGVFEVHGNVSLACRRSIP